ncbi:hypothetical protein [Christiangramia sabulilitoris]|uniref:SMP-30/Gluconolactonase/LRE-like region domain-containing protein n=1 Tax=Christiangramia sabulilitoris TaxID=2583991 RepID=A0A550I0K8_9FLAO|nr:hypothetical protein [Christiangramia sabulilitoris]TRO64519.1 hypothetical protein FGM01_13600 [Christiangramia sabulilitoris]
MKTIIQVSREIFLSLFLVAVFSLLSSCSKEMVVEGDGKLEVADAKSFKSIVKVLVKGAPLKSSNGIDIGPNGNLYVASVIGGEINVLDKNSGKIIKTYGLETGVKGPDDLVFGPDGSLYWTDLTYGEVGRLTPDGDFKKQFVAPGVNPITFSPDGRLFVALDFLGDGLYELDPELIEPPRPIILATPGTPFPLGFLNSFDFGIDGRLYGPLFAAGLVVSVDVGNPGDPVSTSPFTDGTVEVIAGGFFNPAAAKFGPDGLLYVLDQTGEFFKINHITGEKNLFTTLEAGLDNMVFDEDGSLYVTNSDQGWVVKVLPSGEARKISPGGFITPSGLSVMAGPNNQDVIFEGDIFNLREFDGSSGRQTNIYKALLIAEENPPSLTLPLNLSNDGENLIVSSWFTGLVQVFSPATNSVLENYTMGAPIDAVRIQNDIAVSDVGLGGVVWASDNSVILPMDGVNVFAPGGLATDGETLWMADWATGLVWEIGFDGATPQPATVVASGLSSPEGLAVYTDGSLLVVETGISRLSRINLSSGEVTTVAEGFEFSQPGIDGLPPTNYFDGVAVGPSGDIYVTGGGKNLIYRIRANKVE